MEINKTLSEISKIYPTDKDFTHNYYNNVYEHYFSPIRFNVLKVCEIGIGGFWDEVGWSHGNSLKVWRDYFVNAHILGLDIQKYSISGDLNRIEIDWIDQSKKDVVIEYSSKLNDYDIIIDDGSHNTYDQQITFAYFFKSLKSGGIYVLEDLHTSIEVKIPFKNNLWGWGDPLHTTPLEMIKEFQERGSMSSNILTSEECEYLNNNIKSIEIFHVNDRSITSIIIKK